FAAANFRATSGLVALPPERWRGFETEPDLLHDLGLAERRAPLAGYLASFTFDPIHFRMPPKDVDHLNPQQLLMLKVADAALHDAGTKPGERVAVIIAMAIEHDVHLLGERWSLEQRLRRNHTIDPPDPKLVAAIKDAVRAPPDASDFLAYVGNLMASRISA